MDFKTRIKEFLGDKYNLALIGIIVFSVVLRLIYLNINKAVWWDEALFLLQAKHYAFGTINTSWWAGKGLALPAILAAIFKLSGSANLAAARIMEILFSAGTILLTYLIGKKFFGKQVAFIATAFVSVLWMDIFYAVKILADIPSTFFSVLAFWLIIKRDEVSKYELILSGASLILAGMLRFNAWLMAVPFLIYIIWLDRKKLKWFLAGLAIFGALYCMMNFAVYGNPVYEPLDYLKTNVGGAIKPDFAYYFSALAPIFSWPLLILFVLGLVLSWTKKKSLFMIISIFLVILVLSAVKFFDFRYLYYIFPFFCIVASLGLSTLLQKLKLGKFFLVLGFAAFIITAAVQINTANQSLVGRQYSYVEIKDASEWIKQNSNPNDLIMTVSQPQVTYYSEHPTIKIPDNIAEFNAAITKDKPRYILFSGYEQHPSYLANELQNSTRFKPVMGYALTGTNQTIVVILEVLYNSTS